MHNLSNLTLLNNLHVIKIEYLCISYHLLFLAYSCCFPSYQFNFSLVLETHKTCLTYRYGKKICILSMHALLEIWILILIYFYIPLALHNKHNPKFVYTLYVSSNRRRIVTLLNIDNRSIVNASRVSTFM